MFDAVFGEVVVRISRFHLVAACAAIVSSTAATILYSLIAREAGFVELLGWAVSFAAICYPTTVFAMRSNLQDRCTLFLKHLAEPR